MTENSNELEAQVTAFALSFLSPLERRVASFTRQPWAEVSSEIEDCAQTIVAVNAFQIVDAPSQSHLLLSSFLLAAYRVLSPLIADKKFLRESLFDALYGEAKKNVAAYLAERFGITPDAPEKAFEKAAANFKKIGDSKFGRAFIYEQEVLNDREAVTIVRKCFFNDFFRANNGLEVLPLLCAGDELWMEELSQPKYRVKAFRTALLSKGDDVCRFHFVRANLRE